jgi:hypothetical protein
MLDEAALRKTRPSGPATASPGDSASPGDRVSFSLAGPISYWMVATREPSIRSQDLRLAPNVSTVGLGLGVQVVVAGYHDPTTGQMVVTRLLLA